MEYVIIVSAKNIIVFVSGDTHKKSITIMFLYHASATTHKSLGRRPPVHEVPN
jgi:hypothetical protein